MNLLIVALDPAIPVEVPDADVLVVAPAVNSWLRRWLSDEDAALRQAEERVTAYVDQLEEGGVHAVGRVGDADPLQAIADALSTFRADEVLIAADAETGARAAHGLVTRARRRFSVPVSSAEESLPRAAERSTARASTDHRSDPDNFRSPGRDRGTRVCERVLADLEVGERRPRLAELPPAADARASTRHVFRA